MKDISMKNIPNQMRASRYAAVKRGDVETVRKLDRGLAAISYQGTVAECRRLGLPVPDGKPKATSRTKPARPQLSKGDLLNRVAALEAKLGHGPHGAASGLPAHVASAMDRAMGVTPVKMGVRREGSRVMLGAPEAHRDPEADPAIRKAQPTEDPMDVAMGIRAKAGAVEKRGNRLIFHAR